MRARVRMGSLASSLALAVLLLGSLPGAGSAQVMDRETYTYVALDELEVAAGPEERRVLVDGQLWTGGDFNRLWVKVKGERATSGSAGELEVQALYGRFVSAFWDAQAGVRFDGERSRGETDGRAHLILGLQGLAPYWFEVETALFVSQDGDVSGRLEAAYDLLITQRLILEPEVEASLAVQEVPEFGVASGLSDLELSARLRYEIVRELAPYVGISWHRRAGLTDEPVGVAGASTSEASLLAGIRAWW